MSSEKQLRPLYIKIDPRDTVAIVVNEGGLKAGTRFDSGLTLTEDVPEAHKIALADIAAGEPIVRYGSVIGYALANIPRGSWVHEDRMQLPSMPSLDSLPLATAVPPEQPPLDGYSFEGFVNDDGTVGTKNILGITTTVQCVAATVDYAVQRIKAELLPRYPNVDDVIPLTHTYGCGVAIDAPGAEIPIRTLRNLSLNPNFGGEVMVISLGCEKLQPDRLMPAGSFPVPVATETKLDVIVLQDEKHTSFQSMIDSVVQQSIAHLER